MKKTTLIIALLFAYVPTYAQIEMLSDYGETYLPEAGDWVLGASANPILEYVGNFLYGDGSNNAPVWQGVEGNTSNPSIIGKYFVDERTAYRAKARIGIGNDKMTFVVQDMSPNADPGSDVEDENKTSVFNLTLSGGVEKRRGDTRIQGFYGADALVTIGSSKTTSEYGNDIEDTGEYSRVTEVKSGSRTGLGVAGFIGAEYFVVPKISLSSEFRWGLIVSSTGTGSVESETFDGTDTGTVTVETGKESSFGVDTGVIGSFGFGILFHF